jgi:UDP-N-acetylmuramate dehydrogenase
MERRIGSWEALADSLEALLGDRLLAGEPMSRYTTIGVGGAARLTAAPRSVEEVAAIVRLANQHGVESMALGKGSNLIVRDGGYEGVIIKMGTYLNKVTVNKRTVRAEGGASFARLCRKMTRAGRAGLEFGVGIPGTAGGAVRMNAGAFGGEVSRVFRRARVVLPDGAVAAFGRGDVDFAYRRSSLPAGSVVVSATFACPPGKINEDAYQRALRRKDTQPIDERTFGSTFVNPPGRFAAQLIEECGLKGTRRGGAMVSAKHANFIVNPEGRATAAEVEELMELMRSSVKERYGIDLHAEVIIIGNR